MSGPRCVRIAIATCRLHKASPNQRLPRPRNVRLQPLSTTASRYASDITSGFPMPKEGARILPDATEFQSRQEIVDDAPSSTLSKGTPTPRVEGKVTKKEAVATTSSETSDAAKETAARTNLVPPNVLAAYRTPLRHRSAARGPHYKTAELEMRSYALQNLEFYADFAVRAAYYLGLVCIGPKPLRKITERWTMPRSNFVHKKSQENFERITYRRNLQIWNGNQEVIEVWLAFLRKWQFYGVGMKANVWEFESLDAAKKMDKNAADLEKHLEEKLKLFGFNKAVSGERDLLRMMASQKSRHTGNPMTELREKSRSKEDFIG